MRNLILLASVLVVSSGCTKGLMTVDAKNEASASSGRFHLLRIGDQRKDQFIMDSSTGKVWRMVCEKMGKTECAEFAWKIEQQEDLRL